MFTNISWTNYTFVILLLISVYYLLIGFRFYSRDLRCFLNSRSRHFTSALENDLTAEGFSANAVDLADQNHMSIEADSAFDQSSGDAVTEVEGLILQVKEVIAEAEAKTYSKVEVIRLLQLILKERPQLIGSPFQPAINELIRSECEKHGSITLSEEEVVMLWNEVA